MRCDRWRCGLLGLVVLLVVASSAGAVSRPTLKRAKKYAHDHLIVKLKKPVRAKGLAALKVQVRGKRVRTFRSSGAMLIKLAPGEDVDKIIDKVKADPNVEYAERDHYLHIHRNVPNDPDFESCWGLDNQGQMLGTPDADIDAPEAWDITTGSSSVIVGVVDTGVDYEHPDLNPNMWTNTVELNGLPGEDDDGNGIVDDIYGMCSLNGTTTGDPMDGHGHGTHCAGILGAAGNDYRGMCGVNWTVGIMALRFMDDNGYGLESDAATCIDYAVAHGVDVLSNSYGGPDWSDTLLAAIQNANAAGVLFCTSAGNETMDNDVVPSYPACYDVPNIIAVTSTGGSDNISYFSNYGRTTVDVGAPGEAIWSTFPGNDYQLLDGTSMACPFVAGIAALVKANEPAITLSELYDRVMWTGDPCFDLRETTLTGLRVNAYNALMSIYSVRITSTSPIPDGTVGQSYSHTLEAVGFSPPYTWSWSEPEYVEREVANGFVAGGAARIWQADEGMWHLSLPFAFPFFGETHNDVYVCSNGYLEFADSTPVPDEVSDVSLMIKKKMIAVYWSDLTTDPSSGDLDIYVWQPDADSICVRWQAQEAEWLLGFPINVSVVLHSDGRIDLHYGPENMSLVGGVVGISKGDETNYRVCMKKTGNLLLGWAPTTLWVAGETPPGLSIADATGEISGTPTAAGTYNFDVTVEDNSGGSDTQQFQMKVFHAGGPRADFEADTLQGFASLTVHFTDLSVSDPGTSTWAWNFGDGMSGATQNPAHTYDDPGRYTVALTVTDAFGADTMAKIRYIEALQPGPICDFSAAPTSGTAPLTVNFTNETQLGDWDILLWSWTFGDGEFDFVEHPTHTYQNPGVYDVTLEAIDWGGGYGKKVKYKYIVVQGTGPMLEVTPNEDFDSSGDRGGPFSPESKIYTLRNIGDGPVVWRCDVPDHPSGVPTWAPVTVSDDSGTLMPGATVEVTVSIDQAAAATMPGGTYHETVTFVDVSNSTDHPRQVNLTIEGALESISITGPDMVYEEAQTDYTCIAHYDNGSSQEVDPDWSVAPDTYADIDAAGLLTTLAVPGDQTVTITAAYTEGTVTCNTPHIVTIKMATTRFAVSPSQRLVSATGERFDLDIKLFQVAAFKAAAFTLNFDNTVLQLVSDPQQGQFVNNYTATLATAAEMNGSGSGNFSFTLPGGQSPAEGSGTLVELHFELVGDMSGLPTDLTITGTSLSLTDDRPIPHSVTDGVVKDGRKGDFDDNGAVDDADLTSLKGYYGLGEEQEPFEPGGPLGDFDEDGDVDFLDFMEFVDQYGT